MSHQLSIKLAVNFIEEGDFIVAYCPALDLSSCGKNQQEAKKMFTEALHLFLETCIKMGTLEEVLEECGWTRRTARVSKKPESDLAYLKNWIPPKITTKEVPFYV